MTPPAPAQAPEPGGHRLTFHYEGQPVRVHVVEGQPVWSVHDLAAAAGLDARSLPPVASTSVARSALTFAGLGPAHQLHTWLTATGRTLAGHRPHSPWPAPPLEEKPRGDGLGMVLRRTLDVIDKFGHAVITTPACQPPMAYTVGYSNIGRSGGNELTVTGASAPAAARILNDVAERFWSTPGATLRPGLVLNGVDGGRYTARLRQAWRPVVMTVVRHLYVDPRPALQVCLADPLGVFPDDPAYPWDDQPLM